MVRHTRRDRGAPRADVRARGHDQVMRGAGHRARQREDADGGYGDEIEGGGGSSGRLTAELVEGSVKPGEVEAVRRGGDEDDGSRRQRLASVRRARRPVKLGEDGRGAGG